MKIELETWKDGPLLVDVRWEIKEPNRVSLTYKGETLKDIPLDTLILALYKVNANPPKS